MIAIQQTQTTACETWYNVIFFGVPYKLRLWIIVGGTPALAFHDYRDEYRFEVSDEQKLKWRTWIHPVSKTDMGHFAHQNPNKPQGPTYDVLPDGMDDIEQFLIDQLPKRQARLRADAEAIEEKRQKEYWKKRHLPPPSRWKPREVKDPTVLYCDKRNDGAFELTGKDLLLALRGQGQGTCRIGNCIIDMRLLREYAGLSKFETLTVYPGTDRLRYLEIVSDNGRHRSKIKHGAGDRYLGQNGYDVEIRLEGRNA